MDDQTLHALILADLSNGVSIPYFLRWASLTPSTGPFLSSLPPFTQAAVYPGKACVFWSLLGWLLHTPGSQGKCPWRSSLVLK